MGSYVLGGAAGAGDHGIFTPTFTKPHNISVEVINLSTENSSRLNIFVDGVQYSECTTTSLISFTVDVNSKLEIIDYKRGTSYSSLRFDNLKVTFNS